MTLAKNERSEIRSASGTIPEVKRSGRVRTLRISLWRFEALVVVTLADSETQTLMRFQYDKCSAVRLVSRIIPHAKSCGTEDIFVGRNETQISQAQCSEICKSN